MHVRQREIKEDRIYLVECYNGFKSGMNLKLRRRKKRGKKKSLNEIDDEKSMPLCFKSKSNIRFTPYFKNLIKISVFF